MTRTQARAPCCTHARAHVHACRGHTSDTKCVSPPSRSADVCHHHVHGAPAPVIRVRSFHGGFLVEHPDVYVHARRKRSARGRAAQTALQRSRFSNETSTSSVSKRYKDQGVRRAKRDKEPATRCVVGEWRRNKASADGGTFNNAHKGTKEKCRKTSWRCKRPPHTCSKANRKKKKKRNTSNVSPNPRNQGQKTAACPIAQHVCGRCMRRKWKSTRSGKRH